MRILDQNSGKSLENVTLYLTTAEAMELRDSVNEIINRTLNNHAHISDENFQKEITVCIYEINNLKGLDERSINLILNNE